MELQIIIIALSSLGVLLAILYGLKRVLDDETYKTLTNKIVAYIVNAEWDIKGFKKGEIRLNNVVKNVVANATEKEQKLLRRINLPVLITAIFTNIVSPIIKR